MSSLDNFKFNRNTRINGIVSQPLGEVRFTDRELSKVYSPIRADDLSLEAYLAFKEAKNYVIGRIAL